MKYDVVGIVAKAAECGESDKLCTLITAEGKALVCKFRGAKKKGAKLAFAAQPFFFGEFVIEQKGSIATAASSTMDFGYILGDYERLSVGFIMLECALNAAFGNTDPSLFVLLLKALRDLLSEPPKDALRTLLVRLLALSGYGGSEDEPLNRLIRRFENQMHCEIRSAKAEFDS